MKISNLRKTKGSNLNAGEFFVYRCEGINLYYMQLLTSFDKETSFDYTNLVHIFGEETHDAVDVMEGWAFTIQELNDLRLSLHEIQNMIEGIILDFLGVEK